MDGPNGVSLEVIGDDLDQAEAWMELRPGGFEFGDGFRQGDPEWGDPVAGVGRNAGVGAVEGGCRPIAPGKGCGGLFRVGCGGGEIGESLADSLSGRVDPGHHVLGIFDSSDLPFLVVDLDPNRPAFDDDGLVFPCGKRPVGVALDHATFVINLSSKIKVSSKTPIKDGGGGGN